MKMRVALAALFAALLVLPAGLWAQGKPVEARLVYYENSSGAFQVLNDMHIFLRQTGDNGSFESQPGGGIGSIARTAAVNVPNSQRGDDRILGVIANIDNIVDRGFHNNLSKNGIMG